LACGFSLNSLTQDDEAKRISTLIFEVGDGRAIATGRSTIEVNNREGFTTNFEGRFHLQALLSEKAPDWSHIDLSLTSGAPPDMSSILDMANSDVERLFPIVTDSHALQSGFQLLSSACPRRIPGCRAADD
jgi:hypothetical protein